MGDDENGLSEEEYDALLSDLEGRAAERDPDDVDVDDDGDIDEFLASIDADAESEGATKTATSEPDDELAGQFSDLEQEGKLAPSEESAKPSKKEGKKQEKAAEGSDSSAEKGGEPAERSRAKRMGFFALKSAFWFFPAVVLWWVLGLYLGQWVSAGWLIAVMSAIIVLGLPMVLRRLIKRGAYRPWVFGVSLAAVVGLVAPMPNHAAQNMSHYGHWPVTAVAEITAQESDAGFVRAQGSASGWLASVLATTETAVDEPRQLGTIFPLGMEWPPEEVVPFLEEGAEIPDFEEAMEAEEAVDGIDDQAGEPDGDGASEGPGDEPAEESEEPAGEFGDDQPEEEPAAESPEPESGDD